MDEKIIWVILIISTIGTFLLRFSFLWLDGKFQFSQTMSEWFRLIPATAIASLIVLALASPSSVNDPLWLAKLSAVVIAVIVMQVSRNALMTLIIGMISLWCFNGLI